MKNLLSLSVIVAVIAAASVVQAQDCKSSKCEKATQQVALETVQEVVQEAEQETEVEDIVDTAVEAGAFKTLVAAVEAAELVEALKGEGPFTVFAPTDEAFAKLPEGTVEDLLLPENREKLVGILKYHVVSGKVMAADVVQVETAETLLGKNLTVTVEGETVMINGATVAKADVGCSNGVIHVIDTVLLPPADE